MNPTQQLDDLWNLLTTEEAVDLCNRAKVGESKSNLPWAQLAEWVKVALREEWAKG